MKTPPKTIMSPGMESRVVRSRTATVPQAIADADEAALFGQVPAITENHKNGATSHADQKVTLMFWDINSTLLGGGRAECVKRIAAAGRD